MQGAVFSRTRIRPMRRRTYFNSGKWLLLLPAIFYLSGIALGAMVEASSRASQQSYAYFFVKQVLSVYAGGSFSQVMGYTFLCQFTFMALVLFFGFSCIGAPAILLMPLLKGITLGCVSGYLYGVHGLKGVCINLLLFWLPQLIEACLLLFFVSQSLSLSIGLFMAHVLEQKNAGTGKVQQCIRSFLFTAFGGIATSILSGFLALLFAPVFF